MAVRRPVYLFADPNGVPVSSNFYEYTDAYMEDILTFASYVHAQDPAVKLEVNTANGIQMPNQNFQDTYYIAGASTTRVDRFSTEAETPNVSMSTDTYNRIRIIDNQGTLPTSDTNNLEYPLYLTSQSPRQLRAMTRQDFIDTFVTPAIPMWGGANANEQGGTYFLTTSASPANATIIGTVPAAVNSVANLGAYSSGGIGETQKQTTDINYWLAKVDYPATEFDPIEASLPLYFDAGSEQIKAHTLASWTALLGPFLRYYLGGGDANQEISYNINGAGTTQGAIFTDSRRTPTGTGYTTRFVNANDYRTQEFPTGTESTVAGTEKRLKIVYGASAVITLSGTSASPNEYAAYGPYGTAVGPSTSAYTYNAAGTSNATYVQQYIVNVNPPNPSDVEYKVYWDGVLVYGPTQSSAAPSSFTGFDGFTYETGSTTEYDDGVLTTRYNVRQIIASNSTSWFTENGFKFTATGNIQKDGNDYDATRLATGINPGEWCNLSSSIPTHWIRFTDDTNATDTSSARVPASGDNYANSGPSQYSWVLNGSTLTITWLGDFVWIKTYANSTEASNVTSVFVGDRKYERGTLQTTNNYGVFYTEIGADRYTPNSGDALNTWHALSSDRKVTWKDNFGAEGVYGSRFTQIKAEIATDSGGSNIIATGYYRVNWHGQQEIPVNLDGDIWASASSNGLSGSCSAYFRFDGDGLIYTYGFGNPGQSSADYDWLDAGGNASDYQVRFTYTSSIGSGGNLNDSFKNGTNTSGASSTPGPPTSGTWYDADKYHQFKAYDSGTDPDNTRVVGTVDIRDRVSQVILATKGFSVLADQEP